MDPGCGDHDDGDQCHQCQRGQEGCGGRRCESLDGRDGGVAARSGFDAEGGRDLLEEDDHGDPEGESLDHRPGKQGHDPAELEDTGGDDDDPGEDGHRGQSPGAVCGDDGTQDDDHRPGRAGNLDVGTTEDSGDDAGDHSGNQSAGRSGAGADPEGQSQREGDDAHGDPGDEVPFPGAGQICIVPPAGQKRPGRGQGLHRELPAAAASGDVAAECSSCWRVVCRMSLSSERATDSRSATCGYASE